jgi:hypothetical protein
MCCTGHHKEEKYEDLHVSKKHIPRPLQKWTLRGYITVEIDDGIMPRREREKVTLAR